MTDITDMNRLADRIWIQYGQDITDQESFNKAFEDYIGEDITIQQDMTLRKGVWDRTKVLIEKAEPKRIKRAKRPMVSGIAKGKYEYAFTAKVNNQIVYAHEQVITRNKKQIVVYRDRRGRFVKRINA